MKRLGSSDSLGALMTVCPSTEEHSPRNNHVYGRDPFQTMLEGLEEEGCIEESGGHHSEKKRRLSVEQVKALEKNFEVENKLEPERKVKLAQELGLQPRQVAVWFQNRRARWKTKQLERDYGVLKANYEALKINHDALKQDNEALHKQIKELKSRLEEDQKTASGVNSVKKEEGITITDNSEHKVNEQSTDPSPETSIPGSSESNDHLNYDCFTNNKNNDNDDYDDDDDIVAAPSLLIPSDFKDVASDDSDSSAILNEENYNNSPKAAFSSSGDVVGQQLSLMSCFQFQKPYHTTPFNCVKMEEHNFFSADEACNFFSDEQAPSLHWYCSEQWS